MKNGDMFDFEDNDSNDIEYDDDDIGDDNYSDDDDSDNYELLTIKIITGMTVKIRI